jgi:putative transposase
LARGYFFDDEYRQTWLSVLSLVCDRFNWVVHAYCQMTNHVHFWAEAVEGNLSAGMRQLNGLYKHKFNRRHRMVGLVFKLFGGAALS